MVAVVFTIANRELITLDFWPFDLSLRIPLFVVLLASLFAGLLIGGLAVWLSAGRTRRRGRQARRRVEQLERELARLERERERGAPPAARLGTALPPTPSAIGGGPAGLPAPAVETGDDPAQDKRSALGR